MALDGFWPCAILGPRRPDLFTNSNSLRQIDSFTATRVTQSRLEATELLRLRVAASRAIADAASARRRRARLRRGATTRRARERSTNNAAHRLHAPKLTRQAAASAALLALAQSRRPRRRTPPLTGSSPRVDKRTSSRFSQGELRGAVTSDVSTPDVWCARRRRTTDCAGGGDPESGMAERDGCSCAAAPAPAFPRDVRRTRPPAPSPCDVRRRVRGGLRRSQPGVQFVHALACHRRLRAAAADAPPPRRRRQLRAQPRAAPTARSARWAASRHGPHARRPSTCSGRLAARSSGGLGQSGIVACGGRRAAGSAATAPTSPSLPGASGALAAAAARSGEGVAAGGRPPWRLACQLRARLLAGAVTSLHLREASSAPSPHSRRPAPLSRRRAEAAGGTSGACSSPRPPKKAPPRAGRRRRPPGASASACAARTSRRPQSRDKFDAPADRPPPPQRSRTRRRRPRRRLLPRRRR